MTETGGRAKTMNPDVAAALIGAALLAVLLFPRIATSCCSGLPRPRRLLGHPRTGKEQFLDTYSKRPGLAAIVLEKLDEALQVARSLMPAESYPSPALPVGLTGTVTPASAKEAGLRLREAADLEDVTALIDISEELTSRSGAFSPLQIKDRPTARRLRFRRHP